MMFVLEFSRMVLACKMVIHDAKDGLLRKMADSYHDSYSMRHSIEAMTDETASRRCLSEHNACCQRFTFGVGMKTNDTL